MTCLGASMVPNTGSGNIERCNPWGKNMDNAFQIVKKGIYCFLREKITHEPTGKFFREGETGSNIFRR